MSPTAVILVSILCISASASEAAVVLDESCDAQAQSEAARVLTKSSQLADHYKYEEARHLITAANFPESPACPIHAWALAQTAVLEMREGHTAQAISAAESVVNIPGISKMLDRQKLGMNYFILGASYAAESRYEKADQAYRKSLKFTSSNTEEESVRAARIYSDLCFVYMQSGRLREAEESIIKSIEMGQRVNSKTEYVLRMDTLAHLHLEQGRISDALKESRKQLETFGSDPQISLNVRAHLYRDYGELCSQLGKLEEGVESLQKCIELEEKTNGTPDSGLTLATLAQVHTLQKRYDLAEVMLHKAEMRMEPFAVDYPTNAAQVAVAVGDCWRARGRWTEARAAYFRAVETIKPIGTPAVLLQRCFLGAAAAAHHLGNKGEEKQLLSEMKELLASAGIRPQPSAAVVDVLSLKNGNSGF